MSRRPLPTCHLLSWAIHCGLSRTSVTFRYCIRVVPKVSKLLPGRVPYSLVLRCTAHSQDLDGDSSPRSREWTKHLCSSFDSKQLWDEYGIISDVTVSDPIPCPRHNLDAFLKPFTNNFPRADIHELLSCDLLHQVIKGTFKDHLVTWVEDYLKKRHGQSAAARIMSDIDWW